VTTEIPTRPRNAERPQTSGGTSQTAHSNTAKISMTATRCNTLQHAATHGNEKRGKANNFGGKAAHFGERLKQHTATHTATHTAAHTAAQLQHTATH